MEDKRFPKIKFLPLARTLTFSSNEDAIRCLVLCRPLRNKGGDHFLDKHNIKNIIMSKFKNDLRGNKEL